MNAMEIQRYEAISTLVNLNNIYKQQIANNEFKIKQDMMRIEKISSSSIVKNNLPSFKNISMKNQNKNNIEKNSYFDDRKFLQSSVDGCGLNFEVYI